MRNLATFGCTRKKFPVKLLNAPPFPPPLGRVAALLPLAATQNLLIRTGSARPGAWPL